MRKTVFVIMTAIIAALLCAAIPVFAEQISLQVDYANVGGTFTNKGGKQICIYSSENQYSRPVVVDLDKDGKKEIVFCTGAINVCDAATGAIKWRANAGYDRTKAFKADDDRGKTFCDIVVKDIDSDGQLEIVSCHGNGWVSVLNSSGYFKSGWPVKISDVLCTGVAVDDMNGDGRCEIAVSLAIPDAKSLYLLDCSGKVLPGWPQLSNSQNVNFTGTVKNSGFAYGIFKGGIAFSDLDNDGKPELIAGTDTAFVSAYEYDGSLVPANKSVFGEGRTWSNVEFFENTAGDYDNDNNYKWGSYYLTASSPRRLRYHPEFGHSVVVANDVDGDGKNEILVSGVMVDAVADFDTVSGSYVSTRYMTFFLCNGDRTRYTDPAKGFDWSSCPTDTVMGGQILGNAKFSLASEVRAEPVVSDIDNDGISDILINTFDGKLHCFSLSDSTKEKPGFPYTLNNSSDIAEFASAPSCVDINCDSKKEVIFGTFTMNKSSSYNTGRKGRVIILDCTGKTLASSYLPDGYLIYETLKEDKTNGSRAPIAVDDIDKDGKYEIIANTSSGSLCVFKIKGSTTEKYYAYHCFTDVRENQWFYTAVEYCSHNSLFSGMTATTFSPQTPMTREMFLVVLSKLSGETIPTAATSSFTDVKTGQWYTNAVEWAYSKGLTNGVGGGKFGLGQQVTREQIALFIMKYVEYTGRSVSGRSDISHFTDLGKIGAWAKDAVSWAVSYGIMAGNSDGSFAPQNPAKRCEAAQIFYKLDLKLS